MSSESRFFNITELAKTLPETAETLLADLRLTDEQAGGCSLRSSKNMTAARWG
jgi:hypothetical protein